MRYIFFAIVAALFAAQGYFFYFAPCSTVKQFWFIVQTPARCV